MRVNIAADHAVAHMGQTGTSRQPNITRTDDSNLGYCLWSLSHDRAEMKGKFGFERDPTQFGEGISE
jgi:hypothetical protein